MGFASKGYVDGKVRAVKNDLISLITSGAQYLGSWNASTNSPTITQGSGSNANYYLVSTAGKWNNIDFKIGDTIIFSGKNKKWEKIATGKEEDQDSPMLVGFVDENTSTFPTARASGKPLVVGDYVKVKSDAELPFEVQGITFDSISDEAMWNGTTWQEQSYSTGKTNEIKIDNVEDESIDGEGEYQNDLNIKVANIIGKNKTLKVDDVDNIIDALNYLSQNGIKVVGVMPQPSSKNENNTYFYIGADGDGFTSKTFYRCVEITPATDPKTYKYEELTSNVFTDITEFPVKNISDKTIYRKLKVVRKDYSFNDTILDGLRGYQIIDTSVISLNNDNTGLLINGTEYLWDDVTDEILDEASTGFEFVERGDDNKDIFDHKFDDEIFSFFKIQIGDVYSFVFSENVIPENKDVYELFHNPTKTSGDANFIKVGSNEEEGQGTKFTDLTDKLKNNSWNKSHGTFDPNHEISLYELNSKRFLTCKYNFTKPLLDITQPNKVLELPFSYAKPFKIFIGIHTHHGDKFYEGMRHDYFDPDGDKYINPQDYEEITVPIKDLKVEEVNGNLYAHQVIDAKGDLIYSNNFMSNVAPWLDYNEVLINAITSTEVNRVVRPYKCLQRWVELELTYDPDHRYDKITLPSLQNSGNGMQYRYMYFDKEYQELYYGDTRYNYKIGTEQDRTFDNIGDFYIANDTDKIYRYIQDLYETKKENFKVNAEFMYNTALLNNGCRVMPDGKVARMTSAGNYDEDFCILPSSFDGTYEWIPDVNYGTDTGGMADVIGNSIYIGGAIDNINVGGGIL